MTSAEIPPVQEPETPPEVLAIASKKKNPYFKYISTALWVLLVVITPLFVLAGVSQAAVPGDKLYPVKRGFEAVVLAVASVNSNTKASYTTSLADKRFSETEKLLLTRAPDLSVKDFSEQIQQAVASVNAVSDPTEKKQLAQKLADNISQYESSLNQLQAQIAPQTLAASPTPAQQSTSETIHVINETRIVYVYQTPAPGQPSQTRTTSPSSNRPSQPVRQPTPQPTQTPLPPNVQTTVDQINDLRDTLRSVGESLQAADAVSVPIQTQVQVTPVPTEIPTHSESEHGNAFGTFNPHDNGNNQNDNQENNGQNNGNNGENNSSTTPSPTSDQGN